jgi:hypothetical protein
MRITILFCLINAVIGGFMNLSAVQQSNPVSTGVSASPSMSDVLHSNGPSAELGDAAGLYAWLIGNWDARVIDYPDDGTKLEARGEWHFGWVLEGRAIQDVFIVPAVGLRSQATPRKGNRFGTTLRVYDPSIKTWRITWINPVTNAQNRLIARKVGDEIIQDGKDDEGNLMRWSFREIHPNSFHWTGEESKDEGKTWHLGAEFFCTRMKSSQAR